MVIPALNEAENIGKCLESLEAQTRKADEIIVVDNGSEDDTAEVALSYGVKVLHYPAPDIRFGSIGLVRQTGTDEARGDIVVSADADIIYPVDHLEKIERKFASNPRLVLLGGPIYAVERSVLKDLEVGFYNFSRSYLSGWGLPIFFGGNTSFRKNAFKKTEGYMGFAAHGPVEEWTLAFRLSRVGEFEWCDDVYCYGMES